MTIINDRKKRTAKTFFFNKSDSNTNDCGRLTINIFEVFSFVFTVRSLFVFDRVEINCLKKKNTH
jgi:hypothetical protein